MQRLLLALSLIALVASSCGQYGESFGGPVPQSGVTSAVITHNTVNVICQNVEITHDILLNGFEYYAASSSPDSAIIANFLRFGKCDGDCANQLSVFSSVLIGWLDTVSQEFYRLEFNKTGFIQKSLTENQIQFLPKGSILGLRIDSKDSGLLAIDWSDLNPYSDLFTTVTDDGQSILLTGLNPGAKWRYLIRAWGQPVILNPAGAAFVGWDIGSGWNSALIPTLAPYSGSYIVTTMQIPKNSVITGFLINGANWGTIHIRFITFTECDNPDVDCVKYLETLTQTSEALPHNAYHIKTSLKVEIFEGMLKYDLVTPFFTNGKGFVMIDQLEGGRVSIDTSNENGPLGDYELDGRQVKKLSKKSNANWKFAIRAAIEPFEFKLEPPTPTPTTTTPNNSSRSLRSKIFLTLMVLILQLGL